MQDWSIILSPTLSICPLHSIQHRGTCVTTSRLGHVYITAKAAGGT